MNKDKQGERFKIYGSTIKEKRLSKGVNFKGRTSPPPTPPVSSRGQTLPSPARGEGDKKSAGGWERESQLS